jgi:hypothetical protein
MAFLLAGLAAVALAGLALVARRRASRATRQLEPGRVVIASNLVRSRRLR